MKNDDPHLSNFPPGTNGPCSRILYGYARRNFQRIPNAPEDLYQTRITLERYLQMSHLHKCKKN